MSTIPPIDQVQGPPQAGGAPHATPPTLPGRPAWGTGNVPQEGRPGWAAPAVTSPWPPQAPPYPYPVGPVPPRRSRRGLAVILVGLAALGVAGGAYALASGDDTSSAEDAVVAYHRAIQREDCPAMVDFWTDEFIANRIGLSRDEALDECETSVDAERSTIEGVELVSGDEDDAVVELTWNGEESGPMVSRLDLVMVDGRWRLAEISETPA